MQHDRSPLPEAPSGPRMPSERRAWRPARGRPAALQLVGARRQDGADRASAGGLRSAGPAAPSTSGNAESVRWRGRSARTVRRPAGQAVARRTVMGSPKACIQDSASSMEAGDADARHPIEQDKSGALPAGGVVEPTAGARARRHGPRARARWPGWRACRRSTGRVSWAGRNDGSPAQAPPANIRRAARRGVAVLANHCCRRRIRPRLGHGRDGAGANKAAAWLMGG